MLASTTTLFKTGGPLSHLTSSPASDESPIVFVVDDDASVRRALLRLLKSEDLEAEGFETATAFLERDPPNRPSCLVLDVRMPGLSGLDLQEELAGRGLDPALVFITGHGSVPMSVRAMKKGAVDFLPKPFEEEHLLAAIRQAIESDARKRATRAELSVIEERYAKLTRVMSKMEANSPADLGRMSERLGRGGQGE